MFVCLFYIGTALGRGVYFARDASYSVPYARAGTGGRFMYLARVLVGQYCQGNSSMIVPPPKNPSRPEILYESVVDNQGNPSVFVVFYDTQCYPEYLITFWSVCVTWATGYFLLTLEMSMQFFEKSRVVKRNSVFLTLTKCRCQLRYVTKLSVVAVDILKNWSKDSHSCIGCVYSRVMNSVVGGLGRTKKAFVSCLRRNSWVLSKFPKFIHNLSIHSQRLLTGWKQVWNNSFMT